MILLQLPSSPKAMTSLGYILVTALAVTLTPLYSFKVASLRSQDLSLTLSWPYIKHQMPTTTEAGLT